MLRFSLVALTLVAISTPLCQAFRSQGTAGDLKSDSDSPGDRRSFAQVDEKVGTQTVAAQDSPDRTRCVKIWENGAKCKADSACKFCRSWPLPELGGNGRSNYVCMLASEGEKLNKLKDEGEFKDKLANVELCDEGGSFAQLDEEVDAQTVASQESPDRTRCIKNWQNGAKCKADSACKFCRSWPLPELGGNGRSNYVCMLASEGEELKKMKDNAEYQDTLANVELCDEGGSLAQLDEEVDAQTVASHESPDRTRCINIWQNGAKCKADFACKFCRSWPLPELGGNGRSNYVCMLASQGEELKKMKDNADYQDKLAHVELCDERGSFAQLDEEVDAQTVASQDSPDRTRCIKIWQNGAKCKADSACKFCRSWPLPELGGNGRSNFVCMLASEGEKLKNMKDNEEYQDKLANVELCDE